MLMCMYKKIDNIIDNGLFYKKELLLDLALIFGYNLISEEQYIILREKSQCSDSNYGDGNIEMHEEQIDRQMVKDFKENITEENYESMVRYLTEQRLCYKITVQEYTMIMEYIKFKFIMK